jgi:hypothetical protein
MIVATPSTQWKHYLEELYLARKFGPATSRMERLRLDVIERYADELYSSVATAICEEHGITREMDPAT